MGLRNTYVSLYPFTKEYVISIPHGTFNTVDHIFKHETSINRYKTLEITLHSIKAKWIESGSKKQKIQKVYKLMGGEQFSIKSKLGQNIKKKLLEFSENEYITCLNLWNTMSMVELYHTSNLTHLKALKQNEVKLM